MACRARRTISVLRFKCLSPARIIRASKASVDKETRCQARTMASEAAGVESGMERSAIFSDQPTSVSDVSNWNTCPNCDPVATGPVGHFTVTDESGTTYFFDGNCSYDSTDDVCRTRHTRSRIGMATRSRPVQHCTTTPWDGSFSSGIRAVQRSAALPIRVLHVPAEGVPRPLP